MEKIIITTGNFNLIHPGHVRFLNQAKNLGDKLIVFVDSNKKNIARKSGKIVFNQYERREIIESLEAVDEAWVFDDFSKIEERIVRKGICSLLFVKGNDYDLTKIDPELKLILDKNRVPIAFIPLAEGYSTTEMVRKLKENG